MPKHTHQKQSSRRTQRVFYAARRHSIWRHAGLLHHAHTGHLLHPRHSSSGLLVGLVLLVGLFVIGTQTFMFSDAATQTSSGQDNVSVIVNGPPPTTGATILSPADHSTSTTLSADVTGTCEASTLVVIYLGGTTDGSTPCTAQGTFQLTVQLQEGTNVLQAFNYDGLNQPGPTTPVITVTVPITSSGSTTPTTGSSPVSSSSHPAARSSVPGASNTNSHTAAPSPATPFCATYTGNNLTPIGPLRVYVSCITRNIFPGNPVSLGIGISGGTSPYAVSINWGDTSDTTLESITSAGYKTSQHTYQTPGTFIVKIRLTDKNGATGFTQTVMQVNGVKPSLSSTITKALFHTPWYETPVPLYILVLTLALGFWIGDLFDRRFGITNAERAQYLGAKKLTPRHVRRSS